MTIQFKIPTENSSFDNWMIGATLTWLIFSIVYILFGWIWRGDVILYWLVIAANQTIMYFILSQFFVVPIGSIIIISRFIAELTLKRFNYQSLIAISFLWVEVVVAFIIFLVIFFFSMGGAAFYTHMSSASLKGHQYHLADSGNTYTLFECDPAGIVCRSVDQVAEFRNGDSLLASPDGDKLYIARNGIVVYKYPNQSDSDP
jgi:hypothetical protein